MPRDTASRFRREFEEEYGCKDLPFFEGGIAQAHDLAKKELKFLLVILMSPEHDETEDFVRTTLMSSDIISFLNDPANNIILWGGNVLDSEAYQVSLEYNCTKFPFSALVCLTPKEGSTKMGIVKRLAGPMSPAAYLSSLWRSMSRYRADLDSARAERAAQDYTRNLRSEQDSAYERSLALDRERARQRREAEATAAAAEKRAREDADAASRQAELRAQWIRWRASTLESEPDANATDIVRVALMLPEVGRVTRRFSSKAPMEELYAFVECYDSVQPDSRNQDDGATSQPKDYDHEFRFRISSIMPRKIHEPSRDVTIGEAIGKSGNLVVEAVGDNDDKDDDQ